jgi:hypothetical protein
LKETTISQGNDKRSALIRLSTTPVSNTRAVTFIGLFSALYIVTAGIVGNITGEGLASVLLSGGYPEHILRGIFMAGVVISTRRMWSATLMGVVSGIVFLITVPAPQFYLLPATVAAGLVYDLTLKLASSNSKYAEAATSKRKVLLGAGVSGIAESVVALSILTFILHFPFALVGSGVPVWLYWSVDLPLNFALSILGASVATAYFLRKRSNLSHVESTSVSERTENKL